VEYLRRGREGRSLKGKRKNMMHSKEKEQGCRISVTGGRGGIADRKGGRMSRDRPGNKPASKRGQRLSRGTYSKGLSE